jgi:anti-sigma factor RsiW
MAREGHLDDEDRAPISGVIAPFGRLESGRIELDLTIADRGKDVGETINRIHEWVADKPFAQIMYRRVGSDVVLIQTRDGEIGTFSYVADLETGIWFTARLS